MRRVGRTLVLPARAPGAVEEAAAILRRGGLVAFPTETVYGLGADGFRPDAVRRIFAVKGRPSDKPLILHLARPDALAEVVREVPATARALAERFWPGPLALVLRKHPSVPDEVTAGSDRVGVRCPDHPVALALIDAVGRPLAAPSANRSGRPSPTRAEDVLEDLAGEIEAVLDAGPTGLGLESTLVDLTRTPPAVLRPGSLPVEALRAVLPELAVAPGPAGPGPAPRARLILVEGPPERVVLEMARRARELEEAGLRVGVLATEEFLAEYDALGSPGLRQPLGSRSDLAGVARELFGALRGLDRRGVDVILAEGLAESGPGEAIMDRLRRAAGEVVRAG